MSSNFFVFLSTLAVSLSVVMVSFSFAGMFERKKTTFLVVSGVILGVIDVGIPYLFLKDIEKFWGSFLFWVILTFIVLMVGIWRVSEWGEKQ